MDNRINLNKINRHIQDINPLISDIQKDQEPNDEKVVALGRELSRITDGRLKKFWLTLREVITPGEKLKRYKEIGAKYLTLRNNVTKSKEDAAVLKINDIMKSKSTTVSKEKEKALSKKGRENLLFTMAGIRLSADSDSEEERKILEKTLKEKQLFMADERNGIKLSSSPQLVIQSRRFPLMKKAIAALKESYEQWDQQVLKGEDLENLQNKIRIQQQNAQTLLEIFASIASQSEEDDRGLSQFFPYGQENASLEKLFDAYGNGHRKITSDVKDKLEMILLEKIETLLIEQGSVSLERDKAKHKKSFLSNEAIKNQAELQDSKIAAKQWAAAQERLIAQNEEESANTVTKLYGTKGHDVTAFYKVGNKGEQAAGTMETLMWDLAVIMGAEEQFVATGETTVRAKHELRDISHPQELEEGEEKILHWDNGELKAKAAKKVQRGGIQPAQKGMLLHDYMNASQAEKDKRPPIDKENLNKATVASLVFGMFDAHANNIFVTEEGNIKFFDNTRSLPHSNGIVNWDDTYLLSSYRSGLLALKESHEPLSDDQKEQLKSLVNAYKGKLNQLEAYLESDKGRAQIGRLPPGWLNSQKALKAMKERIFLMKDALARNDVDCLRDLVTCSNPAFRFSFALQLTAFHREYVSSQFEQDTLNLAHCMALFSNDYIDHTRCIDRCTKEGIDLSEIRSWCDDADLSFEQILERLGEYFCDLRDDDSPLDAEEWREITVNNDTILQELYEKAELDLKDVNREKATELWIQQIETALEERGHTIFAYNEESLMELQHYPKAVQIITMLNETYPPTYVLLSKNQIGEIEEVELDFYSRTGFVKVKPQNGKIREMPFEEFLSKLSKNSPWSVDDSFSDDASIEP